ncbi:hypothetical protein DFH29DRAFT_1018788 [Suillus ampliporus]|nr:hypothetical protein DFH29DRAFT_1018788 [Suillus ampliporus]
MSLFHNFTLSDEASLHAATMYTREAGIRSLERAIEAVDQWAEHLDAGRKGYRCFCLRRGGRDPKKVTALSFPPIVLLPQNSLRKSPTSDPVPEVEIYLCPLIRVFCVHHSHFSKDTYSNLKSMELSHETGYKMQSMIAEVWIQ